MIRLGENIVDGVTVEVVRKRIRRINLHVNRGGMVKLSVPKRWATMKEAEAFLRAKWRWVLKVRAEMLSRPPVDETPPTEAERAALAALLEELNVAWRARTREEPFVWKIRRMKSLWGCCHWRNRSITYNAELARAPRELVEYVVVHETAHFKAHNHGPQFYALMDERLPGWQALRRRLNTREWGDRRALPPPVSLPQPRPRVVQPEFW